jgi:hypothetical protein
MALMAAAPAPSTSSYGSEPQVALISLRKGAILVEQNIGALDVSVKGLRTLTETTKKFGETEAWRFFKVAGLCKIHVFQLKHERFSS